MAVHRLTTLAPPKAQAYTDRDAASYASVGGAGA
jgi:hypothetical protein